MPPSRWPIFPVAFAVSMAAVACDRLPSGGTPVGTSPGVTVRDSGGVEIVENHAPERPEGGFWTIDPEPEIVIGGGEELARGADDSGHLVWQVTGITRLADGRVAVLSSGQAKLLLFDPSGRLSKSIGRKGDGPGEFRRPMHLQHLPGDTLVVWDGWFRPVSYFDTSGALLRPRAIDLPKMMAQVGRGVNAETSMMPLPDGSFVLLAPHRDRDEPADRRRSDRLTRGEVVRYATPPDVEYVKVDSAYAVHSFGSWSFSEGETLGLQVNDLLSLPLHLSSSDVGRAPKLEVGAHPPSIYISPGGTNDIRHFSPQGSLLRIIRRTTDPPLFTREDREEREQAFVDFLRGHGMDEERARQTLEPMFEAWPKPESHLPIHGMQADAEGNLWVRDASTGGTEPRGRWSVFSPEGRWLGVVSAPRELECRLLAPCWIGEDFFLGVTTDGMGIERVVGHRIRGRG